MNKSPSLIALTVLVSTTVFAASTSRPPAPIHPGVVVGPQPTLPCFPNAIPIIKTTFVEKRCPKSSIQNIREELKSINLLTNANGASIKIEASSFICTISGKFVPLNVYSAMMAAISDQANNTVIICENESFCDNTSVYTTYDTSSMQNATPGSVSIHSEQKQ